MIHLNNGEKAFIGRKYTELLEKNKLDNSFSLLYEESYGKDLSPIFSSLHNWINNNFIYINSRIKSRYFHSYNSKDTIDLINFIKNVLSALHLHNIKLNDYYQKRLDELKSFLQASGGTSVPDNFEEINLIEVEIIFEISNFIKKKSPKKFVLQQIGEGSYAKTFKYKDDDYEKYFVLKRANKNSTHTELERFKREFEIMKKLKSPYVVEVYKYFDKHEYTMEFLDYTLADYLKKYNQELDMKRRFLLINQIIKGFNFLEKENILHRDISPRNILIKEYQDFFLAKISDFGLVKIKESFLTSDDTEFKGSLNDPKLEIDGFKNYDIRHEIYALTKLFSIILSGKFNLSKCNDEYIIEFLKKGTSDINERYQTLYELNEAIIELKTKLI